MFRAAAVHWLISRSSNFVFSYATSSFFQTEVKVSCSWRVALCCLLSGAWLFLAPLVVTFLSVFGACTIVCCRLLPYCNCIERRLLSSWRAILRCWWFTIHIYVTVCVYIHNVDVAFYPNYRWHFSYLCSERKDSDFSRQNVISFMICLTGALQSMWHFILIIVDILVIYVRKEKIQTWLLVHFSRQNVISIMICLTGALQIIQACEMIDICFTFHFFV